MNRIIRYGNFDSRIVNINWVTEYTLKNGFSIPPCQREKEWTNDQNAKFILSIFENKPLGSVILNIKNDKYYILDGQHRINAIELFIKDNFGVKVDDNTYVFYDGKAINAQRIRNKTNKTVIGLTDKEKRLFSETEIFIREYNNLTDDDMSDIIDSINEGIKNDNINNKKVDNIEKINKLNNDSSIIIFGKNYDDINENDKKEVLKYISYFGTIIDNFNTYEDDSEYIQLNYHHVQRFQNRLKKENIDTTEIKKYIKLLFSDRLLNHNDIKRYTDKYGIRNNIVNLFCYKIYEKFDDDSDLLIKNYDKVRKIFHTILENYNGVQLKELVVKFNNLFAN